jgi:hypothetical protein
MNAIVEHQAQRLSICPHCNLLMLHGHHAHPCPVNINETEAEVAMQNYAAARVGPREIRMLLTGEDERKENKPVAIERRNA